MFTTEYHSALAAFTQADKAWTAALEARFGNKAGDVRYTPLGANASPEIARLALARDVAFKAWTATR